MAKPYEKFLNGAVWAFMLLTAFGVGLLVRVNPDSNERHHDEEMVRDCTAFRDFEPGTRVNIEGCVITEAPDAEECFGIVMDRELFEARMEAVDWLCKPRKLGWGIEPPKGFACRCTTEPIDEAVNHPNHYNQGRFEVIDVMEAQNG